MMGMELLTQTRETSASNWRTLRATWITLRQFLLSHMTLLFMPPSHMITWIILHQPSHMTHTMTQRYTDLSIQMVTAFLTMWVIYPLWWLFTICPFGLCREKTTWPVILRIFVSDFLQLPFLQKSAQHWQIKEADASRGDFVILMHKSIMNICNYCDSNLNCLVSNSYIQIIFMYWPMIYDLWPMILHIFSVWPRWWRWWCCRPR